MFRFPVVISRALFRNLIDAFAINESVEHFCPVSRWLFQLACKCHAVSGLNSDIFWHRCQRCASAKSACTYVRPFDVVSAHVRQQDSIFAQVGNSKQQKHLRWQLPTPRSNTTLERDLAHLKPRFQLVWAYFKLSPIDCHLCLHCLRLIGLINEKENLQSSLHRQPGQKYPDRHHQGDSGLIPMSYTYKSQRRAFDSHHHSKLAYEPWLYPQSASPGA